jgi:hypothetical protein
MTRPRIYPDEHAYRKEYNSRPEVKERQKIHVQKYKNKPEIKQKLREYNREYMKNYWIVNPDKYQIQKQKIAQSNRLRTEYRRRLQHIT